MKALLPSGRLVESLRLRRRPDWPAALLAGLAAGAAMAPLILLAARSRQALWGFFRGTAALLLGPAAVAQTARFDAAVFVTAGLVHFSLSAVYALVLADAVYRIQPRAGIPVGVAYGMALYVINYHAFTMVFPWFEAYRGEVVILAHALYGGAAAFFYAKFERAASHARRRLRP